MRRKYTTKLLKEWKSYLYENKNLDKKFKKGQGVIIKRCCPECEEYLDKQGIKDGTKGEIIAVNLPDIKIGEKDKKYNTFSVKIGKDDKMIPEICVQHLKENIKEK